jgi:hypothetical protein
MQKGRTMQHTTDCRKVALAGIALGVGAAALVGCRGVGSSRFVVVPGEQPEVREGALRIDVGGVSLEYSSEIDRIVALRPGERPNMLHVANMDVEPDPSGDYTFFGGAYFWVSPQDGPNGWIDADGEPQAWPPDPAMDRGPTRITSRSDAGFSAVNPVDHAGLVQRKDVEIVGPGQIEVRYSLTNTSDQTLARGTWINTATPPNAVIALRLPNFDGAASMHGHVEDEPRMPRELTADPAGGDGAGAESTPAEIEGALEQSDAGIPAAVTEAAADEPSPDAEAAETVIMQAARMWAWKDASPDALRGIMDGPDANGWYLIDLRDATWPSGVKFYFDAPPELAVFVPERRGSRSGYWLHRRQLGNVNVTRLIENGEAPVALYIDPAAELIEAELYGPIVDLAPNDTHEAVERWTIYPATTANTTFINPNNPLPTDD